MHANCGKYINSVELSSMFENQMRLFHCRKIPEWTHTFGT